MQVRVSDEADELKKKKELKAYSVKQIPLF